MKRKRYSENQIIRILKEAEGGIPVAEVGRKHGICEQTVTGGSRSTEALR